MDEYMGKKALFAEFDRLGLGEHSIVERVFSDGVRVIIEGMPAADVAEVVHGKWIDVLSREVYIPDEKTTITLTEEKCSNCNVVTTFKGEKIYLPDYVCPNCGAKMDGGEENAAD
ncbi:hypothetical protein [Yeguia hominis]|uniref:Uncharacterized protein n=1 Tax=Yeguia hominis TaxID=2763662 RepID=A0A926D9Z0_9FIRM|nr:hypothetical protein [Yeguia hominis]MBC8534563.1 hypothetical protein [Yeguia hominis]